MPDRSRILSLTCALIASAAVGTAGCGESNDAPSAATPPASGATSAADDGDAEAVPGRSASWDYDITALPQETAELGYAPDVAPRIERDHPALVKVELEVSERIGELGDGTEYMFWTFGSSVPGPMIRVREGDTVEFTLMNHPESRLPHNIDLHSVIGQGGGAEATFVAPGEQKTFRFRALQPGAYIYHCATAPVGMHIANGMYGLFVVEPAEGWPEVDREFYVVQSEFYTEGQFGEPGLQPFDLDRALEEDPGYVVFNGRAGSLVGDNAMRARVGETVRIFFGNGGPNLTSSFHVIGEIFDTVYDEAGSLKNHNVQTTSVPPGGATIVEFQTRVPATYILVDHAIFRAFNKGTIGMLQVEGDNPDDLYLAHHEADVYVPSPGRTWGPPEVSSARTVDEVFVETRTDAERLDSGRAIYNTNCASCHNERGTGLDGVFPALTTSAVLLDTPEIARSVRAGRRGDIGVMPGFPSLDARDIADVVSFAQTNFAGQEALHDANDIQAILNAAAE
jgi:nitrite reductase (NO-forming)